MLILFLSFKNLISLDFVKIKLKTSKHKFFQQKFLSYNKRSTSLDTVGRETHRNTLDEDIEAMWPVCVIRTLIYMQLGLIKI